MASVDVTSAALASQEYILHVVENMNKSMLKKQAYSETIEA